MQELEKLTSNRMKVLLRKERLEIKQEKQSLDSKTEVRQ
jgi:hypothetical protein